MTVSADAHVVELTNSGDPFISPLGEKLVNVKLTFQLVGFYTKKQISLFDAVSGEFIVGAPVVISTDENGEFTAYLWPNDRGDTATAYYVTSTNRYIAPFKILLTDTASTKLSVAKGNYLVGSGAISLNAFAAEYAAVLSAIDGPTLNGVTQVMNELLVGGAARTGSPLVVQGNTESDYFNNVVLLDDVGNDKVVITGGTTGSSLDIVGNKSTADFSPLAGPGNQQDFTVKGLTATSATIGALTTTTLNGLTVLNKIGMVAMPLALLPSDVTSGVCNLQVGTTIFVGTEFTGKLLKITDAFNTAVELVSTFGADTDVTALLLVTTNVLLAATYPSGSIYKSTNNGVNWTLIQQLGTSSSITSLCKTVNGHIVATNSDGYLFRSTDSGATWDAGQQIGSLGNYLWKVANVQLIEYTFMGNPFPAGRAVSSPCMFIASNDGLYKSTDYGVTWALNNAAIKGYVLLDMGNKGIMAFNAGVPYRTLDQGVTWLVGTQLTAGITISSIAQSSSSKVLLVSATNTGKFYRSDDYGVTWYPVFRLPSGSNGASILGTANDFIITSSGSVVVYKTEEMYI